jgi:hypothetical protein
MFRANGSESQSAGEPVQTIIVAHAGCDAKVAVRNGLESDLTVKLKSTNREISLTYDGSSQRARGL